MTFLLAVITLVILGGIAVTQLGLAMTAIRCSARRQGAAGAARAPSVGSCRTGSAVASAPTTAVPTALSRQDAQVCAPRPSSRRIHVFPPPARPALLLADAVCWVLEDMRSTRCARRAVLGSFSAVLAAACGPLVLVAAVGTYGAPASVIVTATGFHLGHHGQADVALPCSRAAAQPAARWRQVRGHDVGASASTCTATSPVVGLHADVVASVGWRAHGLSQVPRGGLLMEGRTHPTHW